MLVVAHLGIFWQHAILAFGVALIAASSTVGAALLNRRMSRIEVRLNGRLDQVLGRLEDEEGGEQEEDGPRP